MYRALTASLSVLYVSAPTPRSFRPGFSVLVLRSASFFVTFLLDYIFLSFTTFIRTVSIKRSRSIFDIYFAVRFHLFDGRLVGSSFSPTKSQVSTNDKC